MINIIRRIEETLERIRANKENNLTKQEIAHYRRIESDVNQLKKHLPKDDIYREVGDVLHFFGELELNLSQQSKLPVSDDTLQKVKALAYFDVLIAFTSLFSLFTEKEADYLDFLLNTENASIAEDLMYMGIISRSIFSQGERFLVMREQITKRMISTITMTPLKE